MFGPSQHTQQYTSAQDVPLSHLRTALNIARLDAPTTTNLSIHDGALFAAGGSYGVGIDAGSSAASLIADIEVLTYTGADTDEWATLAQMPEPRDGLVKVRCHARFNI